MASLQEAASFFDTIYPAERVLRRAGVAALETPSDTDPPFQTLFGSAEGKEY